MKRYLMITIFLALGTFPAWALGQATPTRIGFVDSSRVLQGTEEGKKGLEELNAFTTQKRQELDSRANELRQLQEQFSQQQRTLNADARAEMESQIQQKQLDLRRMQEDAQAEMERRQTALLQNMSEKVQAIIDGFAEQNQYDVIFMWDPQSQVYVDPTLDVTEEIIRLYNEQHPVAQTASATPTSEPGGGSQ